MGYDFDLKIDRTNSCSIKWDGIERVYGRKDILPMWIADMDFMCPPEIIGALQDRINHGVFGYAEFSEGFFEAIIGWLINRHKWKIEKDWIVYTPGVNMAVSMAVTAFTNPDDPVVMQFPLYNYLQADVRNNNRQVICNKLRLVNGRYEMDLDDLEQKLQAGARMLILCNPHNPGGRVWTRKELTQLGNLCQKYNVLVISDEIHNDIIFKGHVHTPFASISETFSMNSITCIAPSKTFNVAGLKTSLSVISNPEIRGKFCQEVQKAGIVCGSLFGSVALESAYKYCGEWLEDLIEYLEKNVETAMSFIDTHIKAIKPIRPDGTFLLWLDFNATELNPDQVIDKLLNEAKVALSDGRIYGPGGDGFFRMNIACPRSVLLDGLNRLKDAFG